MAFNFSNIFNQNRTQQTSALQNFSNSLFGQRTQATPFQAPKMPTIQAGPMSRPTSPLPQTTPVATSTVMQGPQRPQVNTAPLAFNQVIQPTGTIPQAQTGTPALDTLDMRSSSAIAQTSQRVTDRQSGMDRLASLLEKQAGQSDRFAELAEEAGLFEAEKSFRNAQAEEARIDREYEIRLREMREGAVGASEGALQAQEQELRRKRSQEKADLAIVTAAQQGNLELAQSIVQQKLDAEFEPVAQQIETLKTFLTLNQDDLSASEKILLEAQINQQTKQLESEYTSAANANQAGVYQQMLDNGVITIDKVPKEVLGFLNTQGYVPQEQKNSIDKSKALLSNINDFLKGGSTTAVGPGIQRIFGATGAFFGVGNFAERKAQVDNIKALMTLDNLKLMTGVLTDRDIELLAQAASRLNPNMKEEAFNRELNVIAGTIQNNLLSSPAVPFEEKGLILTDKIQRENPTFTVDEVKEAVRSVLPTYQTSFNSVGNTTASKNRPQRNNNPGNVKFGGLADDLAIGTDDQGHLVFPNVQAGFEAMRRDVQAKISGNSRFLPANPTLAQLGKVYAEDPNWTNAVARILGVSPTTRTANIPIEQLTQAIARQEGFYA